jgi:Fe-S cluster assembly protein SufD
MTTTDLRTANAARVAEWPAEAAARATRNQEPAWALERRRSAATIAGSLAFPLRTDELWRRTDLGGLALRDLALHTPGARARTIEDLPPAILARLNAETGPVALVVQRNGEVVLEQTHPDLERRGVIVCSTERALREHAARLEPRLGALVEAGHDAFTALQAAVRSGGAFVWVPDGVDAAVPVRLFQWIDGAGVLNAPSNVIVAGKGARVTVIEDQLSETFEGTAFHAGSTEVFVGDGAHVTFATNEEWGRGVVHYSNQRATVGRDAELQWVQNLLGARTVKTNSYFDLAGPGAQAFVHGFMFGDGRQHFDLHTLQRHRMDHTTSDLLIKCALKDRARSVYQGLIQVSEGAQRTDAYQANRNLLLSDTARADSIPGLEILANDVRCTHGATIGQIDPEQLFYLLARGLHRNEAERLIVEGFFTPVIDRIPLETVRERLRDAIQHKIG